MSDYIDRVEIEKIVREVLQHHQLEKNDELTRKSIVQSIYDQVPEGPMFQVICDSNNNGVEVRGNKQIHCDVYFNDAEDNLFCMEFVCDPHRVLTLEEAIKINAAHAKDSQDTEEFLGD